MDNELSELKELAKKATQGEWDSAPYDFDNKFCAQVWDSNGKSLLTHDGKGDCASRDVAFISAANPSTVISLIERLEAAEAEIARRDQAASGWVKCADRCPEPGAKVLVKIPVGDSHNIENAMYKGKGKFLCAWYSTRGEGCTYKVDEWIYLSSISAPPPAVLPPEMGEMDMLIRRLVRCVKEFNPHNNLAKQAADYMMRTGMWKGGDVLREDDAAALGCQPQKVVELPYKVQFGHQLVQMTKVVAALDAAGIPWKEAE